MPLDHLWQIYQQYGYPHVTQSSVSEPLEYFFLALIAFREGDYAAAERFVRWSSLRLPEHLLYAQAIKYLEKARIDGTPDVYIEPEAFKVFIRGGSNVALYEATSAALKNVYEEYFALSVLDIGVGDGLALLPALTPSVQRLDIVEPSSQLLSQASTQLRERGVVHTAHNLPIQRFIQESNRQWDVIQATYSLQSLPAKQRKAVFNWAKQHCRRLLLVEFDVPPFPDACSPQLVEYAVRRYEFGLHEYGAASALVAQGFLLPLIFGYFDKNAPHTNYEQPIRAWRTELNAAGFDPIKTSTVYSYWWANSHLLDARSEP